MTASTTSISVLHSAEVVPCTHKSCYPSAKGSLLELALLGKMIQRGSEGNPNKVLTRDGDCYVNLASQGHYMGVFIGA
jgi:hypothetical protein